MALLLGCLVAVAFLELFLRWYDPFTLRIKSGRIALPTNTRYVIKNRDIERVDAEIIHIKNGIGFRGEDPPRDFDQRLTIVVVGGSTTECFYLAEDQHWPEQVRQRLAESLAGVWLNNAGLDGHSTFGHEYLLKEYVAPLVPNVVVFMLGLNDVGNDGWSPFDLQLPSGVGREDGFWRRFSRSLADSYSIVSYVEALSRYQKAKDRGLIHRNVGHAQLALDAQAATQVSDSERAEIVQRHRDVYLDGFSARVRALIAICRARGILPVLITQPALFGPAVDDVTGIDLGKIAYLKVNGNVQWQVLELYNEVTRSVGRDERVLVIDLARKMPKSSQFYYDYHHFTSAGAALVGEFVANDLAPYLAEHFPCHSKEAD